ncbi:hypothetical protein THZB04_20177 [Vibrio owensii]|nr:hypothetical protein THZB04_20177 [Vibrio owensii]
MSSDHSRHIFHITNPSATHHPIQSNQNHFVNKPLNSQNQAHITKGSPATYELEICLLRISKSDLDSFFALRSPYFTKASRPVFE